MLRATLLTRLSQRRSGTTDRGLATKARLQRKPRRLREPGFKHDSCPCSTVGSGRDGPNGAVPRAVMGHYLPQVHLLAPEWLEVHANDLFDHGLEDPATWPTWTTYISRGRSLQRCIPRDAGLVSKGSREA